MEEDPQTGSREHADETRGLVIRRSMEPSLKTAGLCLAIGVEAHSRLPPWVTLSGIRSYQSEERSGKMQT
jgi:hypothetical protein